MINIPTPSPQELAAARSDLADIEYVNVGGFKAVYKARLQGKTQAVKLVYVPPETEQNNNGSEIPARVKREIDILRQCNNNSLVHLGSMELEPILIGNNTFLIYSEEFIDGDDLKKMIGHKYRPSFDELQSLTTCLMQALDAIDSVGHIHRDVKPGNVMATGNPSRPFVLLDLGIAYKVHGTELTRKGGPPGTTYYMAPELFGPSYRDVLDIRSDIYSAGVTIFEYASGIHPLASRGEDERTTIYRILCQPAKKLNEVRPDLPQTFCEMIDRCIKKMQALRFSTPADVLKRLEEMS